MENINTINVQLHYKENGYVKSLIQFTFIMSTIIISTLVYYLDVLSGLSIVTNLSAELLAVAYGASISAGWLIFLMIVLSNGRFHFIQLSLGYVNAGFQKAFLDINGIPFVVVMSRTNTNDTINWKEKNCRLLYLPEKVEPVQRKYIQEYIGMDDLNDTPVFATKELDDNKIKRNIETSKLLYKQLFNKFSSDSIIHMKRYVLVRWISYLIIKNTMTLVVKEK